MKRPRAGCPGGSLASGRLSAASLARVRAAFCPKQSWGLSRCLSLRNSKHHPRSAFAPASRPESRRAEPGYQVIRRNGAVTPFDASKIAIALTKAFLAVEGNSAAASRRVHDIVEALTAQIVDRPDAPRRYRAHASTSRTCRTRSSSR